MDCNFKPVFAGRLEDALGATGLSAKLRAPFFAYVFFPFWLALVTLMAITLVASYVNGRLEPDGYFSFVILPLFVAVPLAMHFFFNRNASAHFDEIVSFLHDTAHFEVVGSSGAR